MRQPLFFRLQVGSRLSRNFPVSRIAGAAGGGQGEAHAAGGGVGEKAHPVEMLAGGAGAETRQPIGIVVVFGVTISAALTLFVVPALYAALARSTHSPQYVSRAIARLRGAEAN